MDEIVASSSASSVAMAEDPHNIPLAHDYGFMNPHWSANISSQEESSASILESVNLISTLTLAQQGAPQRSRKKASMRDTISSIASSHTCIRPAEEINKPNDHQAVNDILNSIKEDEMDMIQHIKAKTEEKKHLQMKPAKERMHSQSKSKNPRSLRKETVLSNSSIEAWKELAEMEEEKKKHVQVIYERKRQVADKK